MMVALLLLVGFWTRPAAAPVGPAQVERALELEARLQGAAFGSVRASSPTLVAPSDATLREVQVPGRVVVGFKPGLRSEAARWASAQGAEVLRIDESGGFLVARLGNERCLPTAGQSPGIRFVEPDYRVRAAYIPNDSMFLGLQWDKWVMYADQAWDFTRGAVGVKVAILDNGVEYWHPDLAANFRPGELGYDFVANDEDPKPDDATLLEAFHGTHVSGTVAAVTDNSIGVAGWAQVQLLAVKVLTDSGSGSTSELASGIRWAADHGAQVVNMSLGATSAPTPLVEACQYAAGKGVILVAAAGNRAANTVDFPAALPECIGVGATDPYSRLAYFSNQGPEQEVVAPGVSILSTALGGTYRYSDGTSMSTPQVTGVAALVLAAFPDFSGPRVRSVMAASAIDMGTAGRDPHYGYGLVNAGRALDLAKLLSGQDARMVGVRAGISLCRRELVLPDWATGAKVYDGSGRLVAARSSGQGRSIRLRPGTYFVEALDRSRRVRTKVLVLD